MCSDLQLPSYIIPGGIFYASNPTSIKSLYNLLCLYT